MTEVKVHMLKPHPKQIEILNCKSKRLIIRAGRRSGKTHVAGMIAVYAFLAKRRVLYAAPTADQLDSFWYVVKNMLRDGIAAGSIYKNEGMHILEILGTKIRIRGKTAWDADHLRGDYCDILILDEFQMINEKAWEEVGAPMLLDNNGDAIFIYTPPSLRSLGRSNASDPKYASKMYKKAVEEKKKAEEEGRYPRWSPFHFTSHENPYISSVALVDIVADMSSESYKQEILAEDTDEAPGALWHLENIDKYRVMDVPDLDMIVVAVDPSASSNGDEAGIVVAGKHGEHLYVLEDLSVQGPPTVWAKAAITAYHKYKANKIVAEKNNGGEMVSTVINQIDKSVPVDLVWASRGKQTRAEPVSIIYEQGRGHHVGTHSMLESEMTMWQPGMDSPNRMDALCFVAGTKIATDRGEVNIEEITSGDMVLTRSGYKKVIGAGKTSENEKILQLTLSCGVLISCTPDHPIYVQERGFIPAWSIKKEHHLLGIESNSLYSTGLSTTEDQTVQEKNIASIICLRIKENVGHILVSYIERFGNSITEKYQTVMSFIIRILIPEITIYPILTAFPQKSMEKSIIFGTLKSSEKLWPTPEYSQASGEATLVSSGTRNTEKKPGLTGKRLTNWFVCNAEKITSLSSRPGATKTFALGYASTDITPSIKNILRPGNALSAGGNSDAKNFTINKPAPLSVVQLQDAGTAPVYNLSVEDAHEYYANGVLVHNCWAATKLLVGGTGPSANEWLETLKRIAEERMAAEAARGY